MANEISCLKFDDSWAKTTFEKHNFREMKPDYLLTNPLMENEYKTIFNPREAYKKIKPLMESKRGRKIEYRHTLREAIMLVKDGTHIDQLNDAVKLIEKRLGFRCCSIAIHYDEGHKEKGSDETIYNAHAHLVFFTLDERGRQMSRLTHMKRKLSDLQQELADVLDMKHPKRGADQIALDHKAYRQEQKRLEQTQELTRNEVKQQYIEAVIEAVCAKEKMQEDLKEKYISKKDVKAEIEKARKEWVQESGHTAEDYKKLRALNQAQYKTIEELQEKIRNLEAELKAEKEKKQPDRQEQKQNLKEIFEIPEVKLMAKNLGEIAVTLNVKPDQDGILEPKKIVDAAKAMKAENSRLKTLITKATQAIKAKLKKPLITFTEGLKELLSWQQPEPDRQPDDQTQHLKNTLASFRNQISDLYRSQTNPDQPDRPADRQKSGQPEQLEKPKKSRWFER